MSLATARSPTAPTYSAATYSAATYSAVIFEATTGRTGFGAAPQLAGRGGN